MIRGTTAQFKFKLPYPADELDWITIKFWQNGNTSMSPVIKSKSNCSTTDNQNEICVSLDPTDTAKFSEKYKGRVQLMAQSKDGAQFGSRQQLFTVYPNELISNDPTPEPDVPPTEGGWIILDGEAVIG